MKANWWTEIVGWYGLLAILSAYTLNSFHLLNSGSAWYQLLNLTGGLGIVVVSLSKRDYQPMWLNVVWAVIAAIALSGILLHH